MSPLAVLGGWLTDDGRAVAGEPTLRWGSQGDAVVDLQARLTALGYDVGAADGQFGPRTDGAVRQFQADHGLVVDGIVGPNTWAALDAASGSSAPGAVPASHVVFVGDPVVEGRTLRYRAHRPDGQPIAAGAHFDMWSVEGNGNPMVASDSVTVPFADAPEGVYDVELQLPELFPGSYLVHVALTANEGLSEIGHAAFTVEVPASHVVFVGDPVVEGRTLRYRARRPDEQPIPAGAHADMWSIEAEGNPMVANESVVVPFVDAPQGVYDVSLELPELPPGSYLVHVALTVNEGLSEIGHAAFTV